MTDANMAAYNPLRR